MPTGGSERAKKANAKEANLLKHPCVASAPSLPLQERCLCMKLTLFLVWICILKSFGWINRSLASINSSHLAMTSNKPVWDPVNQVYVGAVLPENNAAVQQALDTDGSLRIFGYGSLCWNPGTGPLAQATKSLGQVHGYRRCWAQSSADHRGVPTFPGIVCTLLKDEELGESESSVTAGMIYRVPAELVTEC